MVNILQDGHSQRSASQKRESTSAIHPENLSSWDRGGDKPQPSTGGDYTHQGPGHLSCLDLGQAQNAGPTKSAPLWTNREPEPERLVGSACNPGPASDSSWQSNLESEQCRLGKHPRHEWGAKPVWLNHCEHMPVIFVCSVPPSSRHD